jgi:hypothetical protein
MSSLSLNWGRRLLRSAGQRVDTRACCPSRSSQPGIRDLPNRLRRQPVRARAEGFQIDEVVADAHAVLLLDRAGWHTTSKPDVPDNITPIFLPSRAPELNPVEAQSDHSVRCACSSADPMKIASFNINNINRRLTNLLNWPREAGGRHRLPANRVAGSSSRRTLWPHW